MKKIYVTLLITLVSVAVLSGQNPGCDGLRFKTDLFTDVKKTTVNYATGPNYADMPNIFPQTVSLSMDIYEPEGDTLSIRPVVILAHGGSFIFGDKSLMQDDCERLAKQGYVAASIQYRLYPALVLGFPDSSSIIEAVVKATGDMKAAVRYFREDNATLNRFRADTAHIFIGGYSAGSVAALHTAYLDATDAIPAFIQEEIAANGGFNGNCGSASNQTYSSRISAVLNRSGGIYRSKWVSEGEVSLSSIHGTTDDVVKYESGLAANIAYLEGSSLVHARALEVGVNSTLVTAVGGDHSEMYASAQFAPQVAEFWTNTVTLFESITCAASSAVPVITTEPVWQIYPNPGYEHFQVQLPNGLISATIRVIDPLGRIVLSQVTQNKSVSFDLTNPVSGRYEVLLLDQQGRLVGQKGLSVIRN